MALTQMPKVGDKVRHVDSSYVYDVSHYDGWGDAVITLPDGFTSVIPEEDFEYYELISEGADDMTNPNTRAEYWADKRREIESATYTAEQRQARKGERIVIVEPNVHDSEDYERGDVFTVDKVDSAGVVTTTGNIVYHEEYEVLPADMTDDTTPVERAFYDPDGRKLPEYRYIEGERGVVAVKRGPTYDLRSGSPTFGQRVDGTPYEPPLYSEDNVEKPAHYTQGKFETIDIIAQIVAGYNDPFVGHCVGTAVKYVSRAPYKHDMPLEDMRKAKRYIEFAIERMEGAR